MALGEPPDYYNTNKTYNIVVGGVAPPVPNLTTTTTTNGPWVWDPNLNTWAVTLNQNYGQYTLPNLHVPKLTPNVSNVTEDILMLHGVGQIHVKTPTGLHPLARVLELARHIKYVMMGDDIVIARPIWEALQTYIKSENGYAEMEPNEFLDKMFAPVDK